jgi:drug/metabolite transporter (DMT)-like permease
MDNKRMMPIAHLSAFLAILIWGSTYISTKTLLLEFKPLEILIFRFVLGYVTLLLIHPRMVKTKSWKEELLFVLAGLCGITMYFLLEIIALTFTLASNVGVIVSMAPFFTSVLSHFLLKGERFMPQFFVGFIVALTGIFLIAYNGSKVLKLNPLGDVQALLSALAFALYSILMRKISSLGYHNIGCTRRVFFYGLLFMIPAAFKMEFSLNLLRLANTTNLFHLLFLGLLASALCFVSWNWTVGILGAVKTTMYIYIVPVVTILAAAVFLHERITPLALAGAFLTLSGMFIAERKTVKAGVQEAG